MSFNWDLRVPYRYQNVYVTLRVLEKILLEHYHRENVRRLLAWLHYHNGYVGIGGHFRADGTQPDKPGFAPEGRSFHQNQRFANGFIGAAAVDTIVKDGPDPGDWHDGISWDEVPKQGSAEAARWGLHANVDAGGNPGAPGSESWHIQWTDLAIGGYDLDGWATWIAAGSPGIIDGYPIPPEHDPYYEPEEEMPYYFTLEPAPAPLFVVEGGKDAHFAVHVDLDEWNRRGNPTGEVDPDAINRYEFCTTVPTDLVAAR